MAFDFEDEETMENSTESDASPKEESTDPPLMYPHVAAWVEDFALPHFRRNPATFHWDPEWWLYPEATAVLEALWQSWEYLRHQGATGMAVFFKDYFYPLMREITGQDGPFWQYSEHRERPAPTEWPAHRPPKGLFQAEDPIDVTRT